MHGSVVRWRLPTLTCGNNSPRKLFNVVLEVGRIGDTGNGRGRASCDCDVKAAAVLAHSHGSLVFDESLPLASHADGQGTVSRLYETHCRVDLSDIKPFMSL